MKNKIFILIETNTTTGRLFVKSIRDRGISALVLTKKPEMYPYLREDKVEHTSIDTSSVDILHHFIKELSIDNDIVGIASSNDWGIYQASVLADKLNLLGPSSNIIELCRSKSSQRRVLDENKIDSVQSIACSSKNECLLASIQIGFPIVFKPDSSAGSIGAIYCENEEDVRKHFDALSDLSIDWTRSRTYLIEEAIIGPQFSIEIFNGTIIAVIRQHYSDLPFFVGIGHDFPANIPDDQYKMLVDYAEKIIKAFDLNWGPYHVEIRIDSGSNKVKLIEINPRLVGAYVTNLIKHVAKIDLIDLTIGNYLGEASTTSPEMGSFGMIRFLMKEGGKVLPEINQLSTKNEIKEFVCYVDPGTELVKTNDFRDRYGHVIAVSDNFSSTEKAIAKFMRRF